MSDENKDVNEDLETSSEESAEENLEQEGKDKKDIPYDRFSKVVEERNKAREEAEALAKQQEELKKTLSPEPKEVDTPKAEESLSREEAILYAKGLTEEAIARAKKIAAVDETSLLEAVDSDLFKTWQEKQEADSANQSAQLGASKGSAPHKEEGFTPGQSKEEHKALWEKAQGN